MSWFNIAADGVATPSVGEGIYCFDLPTTPVLIQVTPQYVGGSGVISSGARVFANISPGQANCPEESHRDAMVTFRTDTGEIPQGAFFVSFMFAQP